MKWRKAGWNLRLSIKLSETVNSSNALAGSAAAKLLVKHAVSALIVIRLELAAEDALLQRRPSGGEKLLHFRWAAAWRDSGLIISVERVWRDEATWPELPNYWHFSKLDARKMTRMRGTSGPYLRQNLIGPFSAGWDQNRFTPTTTSKARAHRRRQHVQLGRATSCRGSTDRAQPRAP